MALKLHLHLAPFFQVLKNVICADVIFLSPQQVFQDPIPPAVHLTENLSMTLSFPFLDHLQGSLYPSWSDYPSA